MVANTIDQDLQDFLFQDFCRCKIKTNEIEAIESWCNEQFGIGNWEYTWDNKVDIFSFSNDGDSTLFLLRWA